MVKDQDNIAKFIHQLRQQRGITQKQLATLLGTSQSAVNRMESGKQNLSVAMLRKISRALGHEILTFARGEATLQVEGGHKLHGTIDTKVSKNAAVGLLCAALLNRGRTRLRKIPKIEEVNRIIEVLKSIGVSVRWDKDDVVIKPPAKFNLSKIDTAAASKTRSIIMFLGPLMHRLQNFTLPPPGGCKLGSRSIRPHLYGLEEFGVKVKSDDNQWLVTVHPKKPETMVLYEAGDTVTENIIMAAALTDGITTIKMASANYAVQDLCYFLAELGIQIDGIGTTTLVVHGKSKLESNVTYQPSEDPIESMLFIAIAIVTKSRLTIRRCPIEFLELELLKLKKMGFKYEITKRYKANNGQTELVDIITQPSELKALNDKIEARPYPGLNIDNLPFFVPIGAVAAGRTFIHDWVYENRAIYYTELNKLGANVILADPHRVYIEGPTDFTPAEVVSPPALRPAVIILIAMLGAKGTSVLRNVYSINRGYEDLANRLNALGAKISVVRGI